MNNNWKATSDTKGEKGGDFQDFSGNKGVSGRGGGGGGTTGNFSSLMGRESLPVGAGLGGFRTSGLSGFYQLNSSYLSPSTGTTLRTSQRPHPVVGLLCLSILIAQPATLNARWFSFHGSFNDPR